ncbi:MAG: Type III pantothenate kinase [Alphaproteobacteria bacterium MarineAlpha9_Bin3]|nr:MAG: Type III pantothenate kinase [Alphaproteobacteria bacterium MarineAlpha9_Bin3]|tara:strand:+ start:876 stop:1673 length:798 start_codon:yes stop_codon:yes gene_type:complete
MSKKLFNKIIMVIDVGNTNTVFALVNKGGIFRKWRMSTIVNRTADEYETYLKAFLGNINNLELYDVVISSVVPAVNHEIKSYILSFFNITPKIIGNNIFPDLNVSLERPDEVGADRLVNSLAANHIYGGPIIIIDFGTATTFDVVDKKGSYIGGIISPGVHLSMDALDKATARLPRIAITRPDKVIGNNTISAMQSGIFWGYIGLLEGVISKIRIEYNDNMKVVATGGLAKLFKPHTNVIDFIDEDLTLKGIALTWNFELDIFSQ